ncbi:uncharacterized protein BJ212DRAFT_1361099 [Suillus subaureus]|uniref:Uncharacterized protein n=1 Tax=Suillus subaureus TaxID=48587 RepID=A0A9P7JCN4_9AGAM|nr:uncharacterized protein BJ212DRAFT_1361099 [Suillus subaureus]KAG1814645.1 hypothetical protein BJ212DRAFT_1361099 [Suillus subaureus]
MATTTSSTPSHYAASDFQPFVPQMNMNVEQLLGAMSYSMNKTNAAVSLLQRVLPQKLSTEEPDDHDMAKLRDPTGVEAMKLIESVFYSFLLLAYCLPASLRPTLVQSVIDRIIYPDLRDRIILLRGQFSLADCFFDYQKAIKLHGDDVLAQHNWELAEWWLRKYSHLVDKVTLNVCNRWRRERGELELLLSDIGAPEDSPLS